MTSTTSPRATVCAISVALVLAASATSASADTRWSPWLGCWQLVDESVQDPQSLTDALEVLARSRSNAGTLVCVTASPETGATLTTMVNDKPVLTETVVADGTQRPLVEPDCRGWHRADWSQIGTRLYAQAEISCADQPLRTVSGLSMMIAGPAWIDVQMIESNGRKNLRVRRYHRAAKQPQGHATSPRMRRDAPMPLQSRLTIADVKEASAKVAPETLQAALVELRRGFDLKGKQLIELDEAGVPDSVIDLMVALSFPKRFVVERASANRGSWGGGSWSGGTWGIDEFDTMWPFYTHPYFYTSYYAPFGYRYWGYYDPYYFQGPGFVTLQPGTPGVQPTGDGRVVDGFGYTRVRRNQPEAQTRADGSAGGLSTASSGGNAGSSSGNGGVSSSGYSGGSSSSGGGGGGERTAQPRPPGS